MTLYFDTLVQFLDAEAVSTIGSWHPKQSIFAVASYSQDQGGSVTLFNDSGEPLPFITYPVHPISQATALCWHPDKHLLVTGWENGEVHAWFDGNKEFATINGPHKLPIVAIEFSEQGGRMVTADAIGTLTGWRCDSQGQFLTMFTHELKDSVIHITFRRTVQSVVNTELSNLAKAAVAGDETALDALTNWRPRTAARNLSHSGVKDNHCFYVGTESGRIYYLNQSGRCTEVLRSAINPYLQVLWHPKREAIVMLMQDMTVCHFLVESTGELTELDKVKLSGRIPGQNGAISWAGNSLAIITGDFSIRIWDIDTSDNFLLSTSMQMSNNGKGSPTMATTQTNSTNRTITATNTSNSTGTGTSTGIGTGGSSYSGSTTGISTAGTGTSTTMEVFTCIAYCTDNQTLCAGTNQGNLYTWRRTNCSVDVPENSWQLNNISTVRGAIKQCTWGVSDTVKPCVMVNCIANVYILKEQILLSAHCRDIWATQKNANQIWLENVNGRAAYLQADIAITNICLNDRNIVITNGRVISIHKIGKDDDGVGGGVVGDSTALLTDIRLKGGLSLQSTNTFAAECSQMFIHDDSIIVLGQNTVKIYSLGGVVLKELQFSESEGTPIGVDLTSNYLTVFTMNGFLKIYDISRHEPKQIAQPKSGYDLFQNFGEFILAKCNSSGVYVAATIATEALLPDGKLYIWNMEKDIVSWFDFLTKLPNDAMRTDTQVPRLPVAFFWDTDDNRLLACETRCIQQHQHQQSHQQSPQKQPQKFAKSPAHSSSGNQNNKTLSGGGNGGNIIIGDGDGGGGGTTGGSIGPDARTAFSSGASGFAESQTSVMFVTDKCEIKELERLSLVPGEQLVNLCVPNVITQRMGEIHRQALRDFEGLENSDVGTRKMVLNFSLHVANGNMDQAFLCIRSIQSEAVWNNLARMCVQTGRLDVAKVCLGHLRKARSVRALRQAMEDETLEQDARVAVLAIELEMIEEAEILYRKCGRYDLLNRLLQACGRFEEALKIAEKLDRVHLKNTYYHYAEWLKEQGNVQDALKYYDLSNNATHNITQMLMEDRNSLRIHMQNTNDPKLLKWWAQYIESTGDMESAFSMYQKAEDWFSQVRILCFLGQLSKADSVARLSGDKSACYHLARNYENIGKIQEAIQFYTRAQTYGNAVRICKENDLQDELWNVANSARARDKASAAQFFEECGDFKRAVELYHRAGMLHKAVEMAFASQQPETLQVIASELDSNSDPELVTKCADFFLGIDQLQKAVNLLANAKQFERALIICSEKGVPITESLSELLTPGKDEVSEEDRIKILTTIGDILQEQGDYHTATKKFTQAGDKVRAIKSLLKSGDTDKIVFFAGMSRQKEVYIMAANYLQALNWQNDSKILKNIVTFYSKGQAYDLLANFYANCAQVEIDEFRDYEKAMKALQEASRCLSKLQNVQRAVDNLQISVLEVRKVLEIQESLERGEHHIVIGMCRSELNSPERPPVRHSDIRAFLIFALTASHQYSEGLAALRELALSCPDWSDRELVEKSVVEKLAHECGIDFDVIWSSGQRRKNKKGIAHGGTDEDEIQEEIE